MCTTFSLKENNKTYIGRTMDLESYHKYEFKFFPRNYNFEDDVFGNKIYSKYKFMGTTFKNYDHLLDGVNEMGILGCTNSYRNIITFSEDYKDNKLNLTSTKLLNVFLSNCKSLIEIKDLAKKIYISKKSFVDETNFSRHYHYMFVDKNNNSIILEIENGEIIVKENKYNIMTNSPNFESHIRNLEKFLKTKVVKGSLITPTKRFIRAYLELKDIYSNDEVIDSNYMFEKLKKFTISKEDYPKDIKKEPSITLYYSCISSENKQYYLQYLDSNYINKFSFKDFEDCNTKITIELIK